MFAIQLGQFGKILDALQRRDIHVIYVYFFHFCEFGIRDGFANTDTKPIRNICKEVGVRKVCEIEHHICFNCLHSEEHGKKQVEK